MIAASPFLSVPPNGLVVYCGTIVTEEGKEKKVNIDFEPFKPINTSLYLCDNKFHTEVRAFTWFVCLYTSFREWHMTFFSSSVLFANPVLILLNTGIDSPALR